MMDLFFFFFLIVHRVLQSGKDQVVVQQFDYAVALFIESMEYLEQAGQ